jgi:Glycosyltransferase family 87
MRPHRAPAVADVSRRSPSRDSLWRILTPHALLIASVVSAAVVWAWVMISPGSGWDAHVYWSASLSHPYASSVAGDPGAYLYSPAFRQVISPLTLLPWPAFHAIWVALLLGAIVLLAGPLAILLLVNPIVLFELQAGNIHTLLAVAIVAGFRYPAAWAFVLLTKVTPGVGILWFLVRREWRNLVTVLAATMLVVAVSVLFSPASWVDWVRSLAANAAIPTSDYEGLIFGPLWLRAPLAIIVVTWGALTNRRWTVPVAATLAIPLLALFNLTLLIALVPVALPRLARFRANAWLVREDHGQPVRVAAAGSQAAPEGAEIR